MLEAFPESENMAGNFLTGNAAAGAEGGFIVASSAGVGVGGAWRRPLISKLSD